MYSYLRQTFKRMFENSGKLNLKVAAKVFFHSNTKNRGYFLYHLFFLALQHSSLTPYEKQIAFRLFDFAIFQ